MEEAGDVGTSPLSIDVYVAPMRPYTSPDQLGEGEVATWAPSSSTLISGPTEGVLIDALLTFENADQIAAWAKGFGKKITGRGRRLEREDRRRRSQERGGGGPTRKPRGQPAVPA